MDNNEIVAVVGFDSANSSNRALYMSALFFVAFVEKYQTFTTRINVEDPWRRCADKDSRLYGINLW